MSISDQLGAGVRFLQLEFQMINDGKKEKWRMRFSVHQQYVLLLLLLSFIMPTRKFECANFLLYSLTVMTACHLIPEVVSYCSSHSAACADHNISATFPGCETARNATVVLTEIVSQKKKLSQFLK
jgi:hypothetical protein